MIDPILITGLPRSGTSMIAGLLHECGVWTGKTVGPSKIDNPRGFFENEEIREKVVKRALSFAKYDPLGVEPLPPPHFDGIEIGSWAAEAAVYAQDQGCQHDQRWLYKDAKLSLMWPAWSAAYPKAKWIIVRRKTAEIIRSCLTTGFMSQHSSDPKFWGKFHDEYAERLKALDESTELFHIWPAEIMRGDWTEFAKLCEWLGVDFDRAACEKFLLPDAWHESEEGKSPFYVNIKTNVPQVIVEANIRHSLKRAKKRLIPLFQPGHVRAPYRGVCLVGGGPSLAGEMDNIRRLKADGYAIGAMNNTHRFLVEHDIEPTFAVCLDARASNAEFFKPAVPNCLYFLASRCAPAVWTACAKGHRYMYHFNERPETLKRFHGFGGVLIVGGGTTVGLVGMTLALGMGFREMHLFGYDSCVSADQAHHAYPQPLNDGTPVQSYSWGGKSYLATRWMAKQAQEWQEWMKLFGRECIITVHGDGLIADLAHTLNEGKPENVQ